METERTLVWVVSAACLVGVAQVGLVLWLVKRLARYVVDSVNTATVLSQLQETIRVSVVTLSQLAEAGVRADQLLETLSTQVHTLTALNKSLLDLEERLTLRVDSLESPFVLLDDQTVGTYLTGRGVEIRGFLAKALPGFKTPERIAVLKEASNGTTVQ